MSALRLALRSYKVFYDHVWVMLLVTVVWWCLAISVLLAPAATILLFRHADPRTGIVNDRPGFYESGRIVWEQFARGWLLALAMAPPIALISFNLWFYGGEDGALSFLTPLWAVLLVFAVSAAHVALAVAGVTDLSPVQSIQTGVRIAFYRLPAALMILLITLILPILIILSTQFVLLPLAVAIPGVVATAFSRFALQVLRTPIPDPDAPTEERLHEKRNP